MVEDGFVSYYRRAADRQGKCQGRAGGFPPHAPLEPDQEWLDFLNTLAGQAAIAIDNATLFDNLQRSNIELTLAYDATIEGWSRAMDLRDKETEGHTQRVTEMTVELAGLFGMKDAELMSIRRGALLHDIGKMGVPDAILLKPGKSDRRGMGHHEKTSQLCLSRCSLRSTTCSLPWISPTAITRNGTAPATRAA